MRLNALCAIASLAMLSACSGGTKSFTPLAPIPTTAPSGALSPSGATGAKLTIVVPRAGIASNARKRPEYVSPSSTALGVSVNGGSVTTYGLTASSPGCAVQSGNLFCTFEIVAPPGQDTLSLTLKDGVGHVLSQNSLGAAIAAGVATPVSVTLEGVPASVVVVPGANAFSDTATPPFHIPGLFPVPVEVEALDADGNIIIGPGAPTVGTVSVSSGTTFASVRSAQTTDLSAFLLTPVDGTAAGKSVTVSASVTGIPLSDGTTSSAVVGNGTYLFTPAIAIGNGPVVSVFSVESGSVFAQFLACGGSCGGNSAIDLSSDKKGDVYVAYAQFTGMLSSSVAAFAHGSTASAYTLSINDMAHAVGGVSVDSHDNVFVASGNTGGFGRGAMHAPPSITNYTFGSQTPAYSVSGTSDDPQGIAIDRAGNVFESDADTNTILKYPPNSQTSSATLSDASLAEPTKMVTDAANGLYVVDQTNEDVAYFAAGQSALTSTLSDSSFLAGIDHLMIDPTGNLWVSSSGSEFTERLDAASLPGSVNVTEILAGGGALAWIP